MIDGHALHSAAHESNIPEIDAPNPSLSFVTFRGLTTYKAVRFRIKGCRPVRFRITGNPTGDFGLTSMGSEFVATPVDADDFFTGTCGCSSLRRGRVANSSVTIHAYLATRATTPPPKVVSSRSATTRSR
jgi:hypothetical protein